MTSDQVRDHVHAALREVGDIDDGFEIQNHHLLERDLKVGVCIGAADLLDLRWKLKHRLGVDIISDDEFARLRADRARQQQLTVYNVLSAAIKAVDRAAQSAKPVGAA